MDDAEDIDIVMQMYNLLEYSQDYSMTFKYKKTSMTWKFRRCKSTTKTNSTDFKYWSYCSTKIS